MQRDTVLNIAIHNAPMVFEIADHDDLFTISAPHDTENLLQNNPGGEGEGWRVQMKQWVNHSPELGGIVMNHVSQQLMQKVPKWWLGPGTEDKLRETFRGAASAHGGEGVCGCQGVWGSFGDKQKTTVAQAQV